MRSVHLARQQTLFDVTPKHILPTSLTSERHPVHRWYSFVPGFSPEFVKTIVETGRLDRGSILLDPFAGSGTALVQANRLHLRSVGFEPHPFLAAVCRAKLALPQDCEVLELVTRHLACAAPASPEEVFSPHAEKFLAKLFSGETLAHLAGARRLSETLAGPEGTGAFLLISKALDLCSHSKTDGIYKAPTSRKRSVPYREALELVGRMLSEDSADVLRAGWRNRARLYEESRKAWTGCGTDPFRLSSPRLPT